jgi:hypothetical protein
MVIAYCIAYLATFAPVPAGLGVPDSGLVGALILCGFPAMASVGAVFVNHAASIWVPGSGGLIAAVDPARGNHRPRAHRRQRRSRLGGFRPAEATGTETVDRPGVKLTERSARLRAASSKLHWS